MGDTMKNETSTLDALEKEAKRIEEDSQHSAKGHFFAARRWTRLRLWIGVPSAVLAASAGASGFNGFGDLAGALAMLSAALISVATFLNPNEKASVRQMAGTSYNSLRNRTRIFRKIALRDNTQRGEAFKELKQLAEERDGLNKTSPQIPQYAYAAAKKSIALGEADYAVDKCEDN